MQFALCRAGDLRAAVELIGNSRLSWLQFGADFFCHGSDEAFAEVRERGVTATLSFGQIPTSANIDNLHLYLVLQEGTLFKRAHPDVPVLLDKGRHMLVAADPRDVGRATRHEAQFSLRAVGWNQVIFDVAQRPDIKPAACTKTKQVVAALSRARYADTLAELTSYPARHSLSSHFHDAARRARDRLEMMGYEVRIDEVDLPGGKTLNVVADKQGADGDAGKVALVTAHLDTAHHSADVSEPEDVTAPAPGVNDNGSGSAGVLEMARVFKDQDIRHDVRFILFGGQEQGLCGSRQYVQRLDGAERARVGSVVNMDMIGVVRTDTPTVLLEGGATVSHDAIAALASAAHVYTGLEVHTSYQYDGSDHAPFIDADMPAVLTMEGSDASTGSGHSACDTLNHINYDYALDILRMNTAFVMREVGL